MTDQQPQSAAPPYASPSQGTVAAPTAAATDTARLLGQVMFLVAVAIGFLTLGAWVGQDLAFSTARIFGYVGFGMLIAAAFAGDRLRVGTFAVIWLYLVALAIGLGLGPVLNQLITFNPDLVATAAGGTALTVVIAGAAGFLVAKDLAPWMKPLSIVILIAAGVTLILTIAGSTISPAISLLIYGVSAALILVDFNYLRKHGTEADAVWLATGIFVSIVNIFLSLLNLLDN